ncbi:MAG: hypothetical protein KC561_06360, partial [Myxococcales bacterium]|nr:hypothetical protein [Myxococcales bacterium]
PSNRCVELPDPFEENSVWLFEGETVALLVVTPDSASLLEWNASQSCLALAWELGRPQLPESCAELVDAEYTFAEEGSGQPSERTWDGDWLSASPGSETLRLDATHFALLAEDGSHVASASIPAGEGSTGRHRVTLLGCGEGSVWIQADLEAEAGQVDGEGDFSTFFVAELSETPSTFSVTDESERHWSQGAVCPTFEESSRGTETLATYAVPGAELRFESDRQESQSSSSVFCIDDVHEGYGAQAESEERWSWSWSVDGFELGAGGVENAGTSTECDSLAVFQVGLESED